MNINTRLISTLIGLIILLNTPVSSQLLEDNELTSWVNQQSKNYTEAKNAAVFWKRTFEFDLRKRDGVVECTETVEGQLVALSQNSGHTFYDFFHGENEVNIIRIRDKKANTNFKRECNKYDIEGIFHDDTYYCGFTCGNLKKGEWLHFSYTKEYQDFKDVTSLYFVKNLPVGVSELEFIIPDWLEVDLIPYHFDGYEISKTETKGKFRVIKYVMKDVGASPEGDYLPKQAIYQPHLLFIPKSYTHKGQKNKVFHSTDDLYAWYKGLVDANDEKPSVLKSKALEITQGLQTEQEKIEAIYYWVRDNIRYIAFEDGMRGYQPEVCQNVYSNLYGDCKGMANLCKQMLKLVGLDARLVWLGTKGRPYDYSYPSLAVDNHMICAVKQEDGFIFLDPTEKYMYAGKVAHRIQDRQVLIENGEGYILEQTPKGSHEDNLHVRQEKLILKEGVISGQVTEKFMGEEKSRVLSSYLRWPKDKREEHLSNYVKRGNRDLEIRNIKVSNGDAFSQEMIISYDIIATNQISTFGEETYIVLDHMPYFHKLYDEKRDFPFYFYFPFDYQVEIELELPAGKKVSYLPEPMREEESTFSVEMNYAVEGTKVNFNLRHIVEDAFISASEIGAWNELHKKASTGQSNQVVIYESK